MTPQEKRDLELIGIRINTIEYNYPTTLEDFGFESEEVVEFKVKGSCTNLAKFQLFQANTKILAAAQVSNNAAIQDLLNKMNTLLGVIE